MKRCLAAVCAVAALVAAAPVFAQAPQAPADVAGQWTVTFDTPGGPQEWDMYVVQKDARLSGRMTSDGGEFPITGTEDGKNFKVTWTHADQGRMVEITFKGTANGDTISGTATLSGLGEGALSAERIGR